MHRLVAFILAVALAVLGGPRAAWHGDDARETTVTATAAAAETTSCCGPDCACGDACACCVSAPEIPMRPVHHVTAVTSLVEVRVAPTSPAMTAELPVVSRPSTFSRAANAPRACNGRLVRRMTCTFLT